MLAGAAVLFVLLLVVVRYRTDPSLLVEQRARRLDLVERMRYSLAAASEAEKSAVLAVTDNDARAFADQARAGTGEVERLRTELSDLFAADATPKQRALFATFSKRFADFQRIERDLLILAVKNTNIKAFALAFGPAHETAEETDSALSRLLAKHVTLPKVLLLAAGAQAAALRLETLLAPHIAEQSDQKMDEIEMRMAADDREVREGFAGLAAQPELGADSDLATAQSSYERWSQMRT
jgi:hypothetical protein